jgi:hypothetical protein
MPARSPTMEGNTLPGSRDLLSRAAAVRLFAAAICFAITSPAMRLFVVLSIIPRYPHHKKPPPFNNLLAYA